MNSLPESDSRSNAERPVERPPESSQTRVTSDAQREQLMVQAAKLYYDMHLTQQEIAQRLGLTRWQVGKMLTDAREVGIVRIQIAPNSPRLPHLESDLQKSFNLRDAVVVPAQFDNEAVILDMLGQAAANYLTALSPRPKEIGLSWGHTMAAVVRWIPQGWNKGVHVIALNGGTSRTSVPTQPVHVASALASAGGGYATILPVPGIVGLPATREALEKDPTIADVLQLADQVPLAIFAAGALGKESILVEAGNLPAEKVEELRRLGGVGDVLGRFIDRDGNIVDPSIDSRTVGLHPNRLREKKHSICVAGGKAKHLSVRGALRARYCNILITDEETALFLLKKDAPSGAIQSVD
jgi:deoxyribonucleoside regulator